MSHFLTSMGEILIDFLPMAEGGQTVGFRMHPGGAPFNVAVGMARLGQPAAFASKIGTDFFGRFLRSYLEQQGIDPRFLVTVVAPTTLAFVAVEDGEPAYAFYGEGAADTLLTPDELPAELFTETAILHMGSISLLRGSTPAAVRATAERLKGHALLSFDPNLRPTLVRDEAPYRHLVDHLFGLADVVKVSAVDLAWLAPDRPLEAMVTELIDRGVGLVVITRGGEGVLAGRGAERWAVPAFAVTVVDTVGAGDSFNGGLLAGLAERGVTSRAALDALSADEVVATLRFAAAVAALTCTRAGADPPRRPEVTAFLAERGYPDDHQR